MGGSIAVTIRESNGKEHRMCRWTNPTPYFINDIRLVEKDQSHINDYLQGWYSIQADWDNHKDAYLKNKEEAIKKAIETYGIKDYRYYQFLEDDMFEHNMTSCYAPFPFLAPHGYGLLVIDMKNDIILHSQNYTAYGQFIGLLIENEFFNFDNPRDAFFVEDEEDKEYPVMFREFLEKGRIIEAKKYDHQSESEIDMPIPKDIDEFIKWSKEGKKKENSKTYWTKYTIDMNPFTVKRFGEGIQGIKEFRKEIETLFKLTDEEHQAWDEFIERKTK